MNEKAKEEEVETLGQELNRIRGQRWIKYLLDVGKFKTQASMHEALNVVNNVQMWSQYNKGTKRPISSTVIVVDKSIPGSADVWFKGYEDLPLWDVLLGDETVCFSFIDEVLANAKAEDWMFKSKKAINDMTDSEKLFSILQLVTDKDDWDVKQMFREFKATKTLNEFLSSDPNLISKYYENKSESFIAYKKRLELFVNCLINPEYGYKGKKFKKLIKSERQNNQALSNPKYVLALMAFYMVLKNRNDIQDKAPEYIKNGISNAVLDTFGNEVHSYFMKI